MGVHLNLRLTSLTTGHTGVFPGPLQFHKDFYSPSNEIVFSSTSVLRGSINVITLSL